MNEFKGTTQTWHLAKNSSWGSDVDSGPGYLIMFGTEGKRKCLASVYTGFKSMTAEECTANAHLIAAAPDLLEALRDLYHAVMSEKVLVAEELENAEKAIKKATEWHKT